MPVKRRSRDGRTAAGRIRKLLLSNDVVSRQVGLILNGFAKQTRAEGAFYLHFCALAPLEVFALCRFWRLEADDSWGAFRRVCRFFAM